MTTGIAEEQRQHREILKKVEEDMKDLRQLLEKQENAVCGTKENMEGRVQEIENTAVKLLKQSYENNIIMKETEHLRSACDQMDEAFEKVLEERNKLLAARLTDHNNNAELNETAGCEQGTGTLSSSKSYENATSPVDLKQSKSEGKFAVRVFLQITNTLDRCSVNGATPK